MMWIVMWTLAAAVVYALRSRAARRAPERRCEGGAVVEVDRIDVERKRDAELRALVSHARQAERVVEPERAARYRRLRRSAAEELRRRAAAAVVDARVGASKVP